jgi:hypothetical protein
MIEFYQAIVSPLKVTPGSTTQGSPINATISQVSPPPPVDDTGVTPSAFICYSTNGSPTFNALTCAPNGGNVANTFCAQENTHPFTFSAPSTTLRFAGCKPGYLPTGVFGPFSYNVSEYNFTIVINGAKDFVDAEHLIGTSDGSYSAWISWDEDNMFFGMNGPGVGTVVQGRNDYVHFYVRGDTGDGQTNTPDTLGASEFGSTNLPTTFTDHVFWRTDQGHTARHHYNGVGWGGETAAGVNVGFGAPGATYVEMSLSRTSVGLGATASHMIFVGGYNAGGTVTQVSAPGPLWTKYIDANMGGFVLPKNSPILP